MAEGIKARDWFCQRRQQARCRITIVFCRSIPRNRDGFPGLELYGKSLYEIADKKDVIIVGGSKNSSPSANGTA